MFVDYSGSMGCILRDVLRHIINMALFCRQVGIPFNVYAFTSDTTPRAASKSVPYYLGQNEVYSQDKILVSNTVLFDLVNSELSKADFNTALFSLWLRSKDDSARAACENLGNTPLNETLIIAHEIINQFRAKHNPDKVTTLFLTDGEGHALKIGMSSVLNDVRITSNKNDLSWNTGRLTSFKLNGRQVRAATWGNCESTEQAMTPALIENLRITTGAEVIGFYIPATRSRLQSNALEALRYTKHKLSTYAAWTSQYEKIYKQDDMVSIPGAFNYSNYFIIAGSDISTDDEELEVTPDMTRNRIARAFKNYSASKKANRIFVSKFAEAIA
jgi:hypothetical protein